MGFGVNDAPNMLEDYIVTDSCDNVPYFMLTDKSSNGTDGEGPKFFSWSKQSNCNHDGWSYYRPGLRVVTHMGRNYYWNNTSSLTMTYMQRGDIQLFHTCLFMMQEERGDTNIIMSGIVKEENLFMVKEMLRNNDINVNNKALETIAPFVEIWLADDFDIPKSRFYSARMFYRRQVRKRLIENGFRIYLKPRAEMNALLIQRKVKFATLDLLQTKINSLCQIAASSEMKQLSSLNT